LPPLVPLEGVDDVAGREVDGIVVDGIVVEGVDVAGAVVAGFAVDGVEVEGVDVAGFALLAAGAEEALLPAGVLDALLLDPFMLLDDPFILLVVEFEPEDTVPGSLSGVIMVGVIGPGALRIGMICTTVDSFGAPPDRDDGIE
jgi:hypothetical protein